MKLQTVLDRPMAWAAASLLAVSLGGCVSSMQNSPAVDALKSAADGSSGSQSPFVEATVEYPGPAGRWGGPASFLLSLNAREAGDARISVIPQLWGAEATPPPAHPVGGGLAHEAHESGTVRRAPASQNLGIPADFVRERIAQLAVTLQAGAQGPAATGGCLYPVRLRLVRADGGVMERQGCRGVGSWTGAVSGFTSEFLTALTQPARTAKLLERSRRAVASAADVSKSEQGKAEEKGAHRAPASTKTSAHH